MIIALTGKKGSGKSTVAEYIAAFHGFQQYAFADPMKEACKLIFGWTDEYVNGSLKEHVDPVYGVSPRHALQSLGTEWGQHTLCEHDTFRETTWRMLWVRRFVDTVYDDSDWVISDMRFPHELEGLHEAGCPVVSIRVTRPGHCPQDMHSSETEMDLIAADHVLINTGTIDDLYADIDTIMEHIAGGAR